jgi:hypothetical protein
VIEEEEEDSYHNENSGVSENKEVRAPFDDHPID